MEGRGGGGRGVSSDGRGNGGGGREGMDGVEGGGVGAGGGTEESVRARAPETESLRAMDGRLTLSGP